MRPVTLASAPLLVVPFVPLLLVACLGASACGADDGPARRTPDGPPAASPPASEDPAAADDDETPDADEQLASLGVEDDELVADEEDATGLAEAPNLPTSNLEDPDPSVSPWADVEGDDPSPPTPEDDALPTPEGLDRDLVDVAYHPDAPDELPEPGPEAPEVLAIGGPSPAVRVQAAPSAPAVSWWNRTYACPYGAKDCICRGSPFNCQFPNAQPGRNRYLPPAAMRAIRSMPRSAKTRRLHAIDRLGKWDVPEGTPIHDGLGFLRGTLRASGNRKSGNACWSYRAETGKFRVVAADHPCVMVNFGQVKTMTVAGATSAAKYVYAFATNQGSSWIPLDAVRALVKDGEGRPAFRAYDRAPRRPLVRDQKTAWVHWLKAAEDYGATFDQYAPTDAWLRYLPRWARLKVRPKSEISKAVDPKSPLPGTSEMARDYLLRSQNVLNLVYQTPLLGGAATDTFVVRRHALAFRRVESRDPDKRTILRIPLYRPKTVSDPGTRKVGKMYFLFGEVDGRYGWVAAQAIKGERPEARCARGDVGWFCARDGRGYECAGGQVTQGRTCTLPGHRCKAAADDRASLGPNAELVCEPR